MRQVSHDRKKLLESMPIATVALKVLARESLVLLRTRRGIGRLILRACIDRPITLSPADELVRRRAIHMPTLAWLR